MKNTTKSPPASRTSTVAALPDRVLLAQTLTLARHEQALQILVLDHMREIASRRLYLGRGFSSLFHYAVRELGYSDGAAWRRIKAMRLCSDTLIARERLEDGSLSLSAAAQLQNAFERWDRDAACGPRPATDSATPEGLPRGGAAVPAAAPQPGVPVDAAAREQLVEQAVGKSTREVKQMLASVDPESALPDDRMRALGGGRWELKVVIDADCQCGLEKLKDLLSHVDPHQTMGKIVARLVRDGLNRYDPARPRRSRSKSAQVPIAAANGGSRGTPATLDSGKAMRANGTSSAKPAPHKPVATAAARLNMLPAESAASHTERTANRGNGPPTLAPPGARTKDGVTSPPNGSSGRRDCAIVPAKDRAQPANAVAVVTGGRTGGSCLGTSSRARHSGNDTSPAKLRADREPHGSSRAGRRVHAAEVGADTMSDGHRGTSLAKWAADRESHGSPRSGQRMQPTEADADTTSDGHRGASLAKWVVAGASLAAAGAQDAGTDRSRQEDRVARIAATPRSGTRRAIPARVKREVWQRDGGECSFVDPGSGRRCGSRFLLEIDHVVPYAVGGTHDAGNLRVYCGAHHRYRHATAERGTVTRRGEPATMRGGEQVGDSGGAARARALSGGGA